MCYSIIIALIVYSIREKKLYISYNEMVDLGVIYSVGYSVISIWRITDFLLTRLNTKHKEAYVPPSFPSSSPLARHFRIRCLSRKKQK